MIAELVAEAAPAISTLNPLVALSPAAGPTVDFDTTVLFQAMLFLILMLALRPLLFDPLLRVFEEREKRTDGVRSEARALEEHAAELLAKYEKEHDRVVHVLGDERDRMRTETTQLESQILGEARIRATHVVDEGRASVAHEAAALRAEFARRSGGLAKELATAVLGREVA
jgi:F-type H+-transporting ATPase subunit b